MRQFRQHASVANRLEGNLDQALFIFAEFRVVCIYALQGQEGNKSYHSLLSAEQLARINTLFSLSYGMPRVDDSKFVRGIIPII